MTHYEICKELLHPIRKEDNKEVEDTVDEASKSKNIINNPLENNDEAETMKD